MSVRTRPERLFPTGPEPDRNGSKTTGTGPEPDQHLNYSPHRNKPEFFIFVLLIQIKHIYLEIMY